MACGGSAAQTSALIIGHAGSKEDDYAASNEDGDLDSTRSGHERALHTAVLRDQAALQDFLNNRGCCIETGTMCDTDLTKDDCLERIERFFEDKASPFEILAFLGNATEDGAWLLADGGCISFDDIWDRWHTIRGLSQDKLLIISDSCFSGKFCSRASELALDNIFVQASSHGDDTSCDHVFISLLLLIHQSPEDEHELLSNFRGRNQTTPTYYVPKGMSNKLVFGSLTLQLLGDAVDVAETYAHSSEEAPSASPKSDWQDYYGRLPPKLQLVVAELSQRDGWIKSSEFALMTELMCTMCRKEDRRGGDDEPDFSDILELLQEFLEDASLSAAQALEKFREEFD